MECACGQARRLGLDPTDDNVYNVFVGKSCKVMKLLHWERGGYVMYYKHLEQSQFHPNICLRQGVGFCSMRWDELVLLMEEISPKVARRHSFEIISEKTEKTSTRIPSGKVVCRLWIKNADLYNK